MSGAALAAATTSFSVLNFDSARATITTGVYATCATGTRSLVVSKPTFLYSQGATIRLSFWPITMS
ncbi:hypothetical protein D9M68_974580 [compost metagenome]